ESKDSSVFFFQAEDGIRDKLVTGVQTCALPISGLPGKLLGVPDAVLVTLLAEEELALPCELLLHGVARDQGVEVGLVRPRLGARSEERRVGKECRARGAR